MKKFTEEPLAYAQFRDLKDTNYLRSYDECAEYSRVPQSRRRDLLNESLQALGRQDMVDNPTNLRTMERFTNPEDVAAYAWSSEHKPFFQDWNFALLTDDPEMLRLHGYLTRALSEYIRKRPPQKAVKVWRGTKIRRSQRAQVGAEGGPIGGPSHRGVFRLPCFTACTTDLSVASMYCDESEGSPILEFEVPKGCADCAMLEQRVCQIKDEAEWLLKAYTPVRYLREEVRKILGRNILVVTLEVLDGMGVKLCFEDAKVHIPSCLVMVQDGVPAGRPQSAAAPASSTGSCGSKAGGQLKAKVLPAPSSFAQVERNSQGSCGAASMSSFAESAVGNAQHLPSQSSQCPRGHALSTLPAGKQGAFTCDVCGKPWNRSAVLRGCRICDWDVCDMCYWAALPHAEEVRAFVEDLRLQVRTLAQEALQAIMRCREVASLSQLRDDAAAIYYDLKRWHVPHADARMISLRLRSP